jgi:hypothetical protein
MKIYICIIAFLSIYHLTIGQQVINIVLDPSARFIRGITIPAMLFGASFLKDEQSKTIIPKIIREEELQLKKWKLTVRGNANTLNNLYGVTKVLTNSIENSKMNIFLNAPGFGKTKRKYELLKKRADRLNDRIFLLWVTGIKVIDGEGYYRVASKRLALEYLEVYSELSQINFKLLKFESFSALLPYNILLNKY